jgi:hypothetical protein
MPPRKDRDPASHIGFLDEAEGTPHKKRRAGPRKDEALDLDRIW